MKKCIYFPLTILFSTTLFSQNHNDSFCENHNKLMNNNKSPEDKAYDEAFEIYSRNYEHNNKKRAQNKYIIPVVFHVFGTVQNGYYVTNTLITNALKSLNDDFKGYNDDFYTVHDSFVKIRGEMLDVEFVLAKKDPSGNATNGIKFYSTIEKGFGNIDQFTEARIKNYAWNNYHYMNVYVMADLYNDGNYNKSGVAWLPDLNMTKNNLARVVYNGKYIGTNTNKEFASTLTHEFGHFFNLKHTFDGGCYIYNDGVGDTPPCNYPSDKYSCHANSSINEPLNCYGYLINVENYMDYSGATNGCYKMFTKGQVNRMYAAMSHSSRVSLWQDSTLYKTGILKRDTVFIKDTIILKDTIIRKDTIFQKDTIIRKDTIILRDTIYKNTRIDSPIKKDIQLFIFPNPVNNLLGIEFSEQISFNSLHFELFNANGQKVISLEMTVNEKLPLLIPLDNLQSGIYYIRCVETNSSKKFLKLPY